MRSICSCLLVFLLCLPSSSFALEAEKLDNQGREGIWMPTKEFDKLLQNRNDLKDAVDLQTKLTDLQFKIITTATQGLARADILLTRSDQLTKALTDELESRDSFFQNPFVLFLGGAVFTGLAITLGVVIAK